MLRFELQSFIFEGSLAQKLRFWSSKLHFWRKFRTKASFLIQSLNFEGNLAQKLRFWASKLQFWRESRRKASFAKIIWITHQLTTKSLEPQIIWHPNRLNLKSLDCQVIWISNRLTTDNQFIWISERLTTKSLESQLTTNSLESQISWQTKSIEPHIDWQPNHLNFKSTDNQLTRISNRLTTKSFESQLDWQPNRLNLKSIVTTSLEAQSNRQPKSFETHRLTTKSFESQITWQSKSLESHFTWIWHQLTFEPVELHTPSSYRFLISGNFRHHLARKLQNKTFLRDFLQNWNFEAAKRIFSARLPSRFKLGSSKNEAFLRDFLQKWSFEAQKRSFCAKLPSKMKLWSSKTKLLRRRGANFAELNFQKCSDHAAWCFFSQKSLSRAGVAQVLRSSTSKSAPTMQRGAFFLAEIALVRRRGANFATLNFQKCSEHASV